MIESKARTIENDLRRQAALANAAGESPVGGPAPVKLVAGNAAARKDKDKSKDKDKDKDVNTNKEGLSRGKR